MPLADHRKEVFYGAYLLLGEIGKLHLQKRHWRVRANVRREFDRPDHRIA